MKNYKFSIPKKPKWIKKKFPINIQKIQKIKEIIKFYSLNTVCKEASCPNLYECFSSGVVTFMIMGSICTRKCHFCNVKKGKPNHINSNEPLNIANVIKIINLKYVVITSVTRDDLKDGGAKIFAKTINYIRKINKKTKIEILVPDFRKKTDLAIKILSENPPDIFGHNIETVPRIYKKVCPDSSYKSSLDLLYKFNKLNPKIPIKSGLMIGLGEKYSEILKVMKDLYKKKVTILTVGQYLQPSPNHLPVKRYFSPFEFNRIKKEAIKIGFKHVTCGPLVRSSYRADLQIKE